MNSSSFFVWAFVLGAGLSTLRAAPVAYISNTSSDDVWVVDINSQAVTAVIPVGDDPRGIAASPDGARLYVANRFDNTVSVIATASNTVVQTIDLGNSATVSATEPYDVVVSPNGTRLYVAMKNGGSENGDGTVVFVDLPLGTIVAEVVLDASASPEGIVISPNGNRLYVAARGQVYVIDVPTMAFVTKTGVGQRELAITPDGQFVFANDNMVRTSDNAALPAGVFIGERGVAISSSGNRLFSVNEGNSIAVHSVDRSGPTPVLALVTNITDATESQAYGIDLTADGSLGLVSFRGSDSVRVFSTSTLNFVGPAIPMQFNAQSGNEPKQLAIVEVSGPLGPDRLLNLSTRMRILTGDNVLIGGIIFSGPAPKELLFRSIGPSMTVGGVPVSGSLQDPVMTLHDSSGAQIAQNDDWMNAPEPERTLIANSGLAPSDNREPAILRTLPPAAYTVIVRGKNETTGIATVEAYDRDTIALPTSQELPNGAFVPSRLLNISTRGLCSTADNLMIAGAIIGGGGGGGLRVIVRGIGPSLQFNGLPVAGRLADPTLALVDQNGTVIASNNDWKLTQQQEIEDTQLAPTADLEAAIVVQLPPGPVMAHLRGNNNSSGIGLVEIYELPEQSNGE